MTHNLKLIAILMPIVFVIDMVWLGILMKGFYAQELGELMRRNADGLAPRWLAAVWVYLLIAVGVVLFVLPQTNETTPLWQTFVWGALFGLVCYGIYDFTNLAVLEKWTLRVTIVDIAWGCALNGTTALIAKSIAAWIGRNNAPGT